MMNKNGFSIIELIVVIAILGILLSIATISGTTWRNKYRMESQMKEMFIDLMNARANAMSKNRMHFVALTGTQYTIFEDTNPGPDGNRELEDATVCPACDGQVMQKNLNPNYPITPAPSQVNFDSRGLATAGLQTIRLSGSSGATNDCIVISATRILMGGWNGTDCVTQ